MIKTNVYYRSNEPGGEGFGATGEQYSRQRGFSLIYVILVILGLSTLGAALATLTQSGFQSQLNESAIAQARYIAISGFNYVKQFKEDYLDLDGLTFNFGNAGQFTVSDMRYLPTISGRLEARVVGTVYPGTAREANYVIFQEFDAEDQGAITFRENFDDFDVITSDPSKTPVVKNADNTFTVGANQYFAFGGMYYTGDKELNWGDNNCTAGSCDFKEGFRMFFVSSYTSSQADGLVFTWFNDENNTTTSIGGDSQHGEMIGYAADSRVYTSGSYGDGTVKQFLDGHAQGIQPPKMGVEFDNYRNHYTSTICSSDRFTGPRTSRRADHDDSDQWRRAHIAYVFWGQDVPTDIECAYWWKQNGGVDYQYKGTDDLVESTWEGAYAYDDNRHGRGFNVDNTQYWRTTFNWTNNSFAFRLEVERSVMPNVDGNYEYTLKSWIRQCTQPLCAEYFDRGSADADKDKLYFSDTSRFLCDGDTDYMTGKCDSSNYNTPILTQTVELDPTQHDFYEQFIFGFTEATGGSTQDATFSEFILQFIKENDYGDVFGTQKKRRVINRLIN
jgi:type II secretory pathway pseudopilin PulG